MVFPLLDLLMLSHAPSEILSAIIFLFFLVVVRKCISFFVLQVKWRDCNWIWRIWARSCLGAVLPTWRSDWSLCYNILDQNYNALLYVQIRKREAATLLWVILYLRTVLTWKKQMIWVTTTHTISQEGVHISVCHLAGVRTWDGPTVCACHC